MVIFIRYALSAVLCLWDVYGGRFVEVIEIVSLIEIAQV